MKKLTLFYVWSFLLLIGALQLVAPVTYHHSALPGLLMIIPSALLWSVAAAAARDGPLNLALSERAYSRTVRFLVILSVVFTLLAYTDFFLISGRSLFTIFADREAANLSGRSGSALGGVIALLSASPIVLLALRYVYAFSNGHKTRLSVDIAIAVVAIPPLLFSGGRNPIIVAVLFLVVTRMICMKRSRTAFPRLSLKSLVKRTLIIAGAITLLWYVVYVSIARRVLHGTLFDYHQVLIQYSLDTTDVYEFLYSIDPGLSAGLTNLYYYLTHAIYRLSEMPSAEWATTGGFATFPLYLAILEFVFGGNFLELFESRLMFPGNYTTLWGSFYQDGHALGLILGVLGVFILMVLLLKRTRYSLLQFLLLVFLLLSVWIAPIYSIISTGFGGSLFFVCVSTGIVAQIRLGGRRRSNASKGQMMA